MEKRDFTKEFVFISSRSSAPGGQNVNKVNTKMELRFDIERSKLLNDAEKILMRKNLKNKVTIDGILQIVSQEERSQLRNKQKCIEKFYSFLEKALKKPKKRKKVKPSPAMKESRLLKKRKKSEKKELRKNVIIDTVIN